MKKAVLIVCVIILALALGFLGSKMIGPAERTDLPEESGEGDLDVGGDVDADSDLLDGRELTGEEGETVDGVRVLGPNEPTRVDPDRDFFEGLEDMDGAVPVDTGSSGGSEMDRVLDNMEKQGASNSSTTAKASAGASGGTATGSTGSNTQAAGGGSSATREAVQRPGGEMADLLDQMEQGGE